MLEWAQREEQDRIRKVGGSAGSALRADGAGAGWAWREGEGVRVRRRVWATVSVRVRGDGERDGGGCEQGGWREGWKCMEGCN